MHSYCPERLRSPWLPLIAFMCLAALVASERPGSLAGNLAPDVAPKAPRGAPKGDKAAADRLAAGDKQSNKAASNPPAGSLDSPEKGEKGGDGNGKSEEETAAEEEDLFGDGFVGKSIRITDPGPYKSVIKPRALGYVIRAADKGPTPTKPGEKPKNRPQFKDRNFQLNIHDYPGPVILTGAHFEITEDGAVGEELVNKYLRLLRRPVRKRLREAGLKQKMLGQVDSYVGIQDIGGFQEEAYRVQFLTEPYLRQFGKPLIMHRHEFEIIPKPEHPPETIASPANLHPPGTEVRVHKPMGDPSKKMMLQDQHGVVKGYSTLTGMYLVYLTLYARNADLFPDEIELWKDKGTPKVLVRPDGKRKDCNYTNMQKFEQRNLGRLDAIKREITQDKEKLWGKAQEAVGKQNAYVNTLWENQMLLGKFTDNVATFQAKAAQSDEKTNAEIAEMVRKGDREVDDSMTLSNQFREVFKPRYEAMRAAPSDLIDHFEGDRGSSA